MFKKYRFGFDPAGLILFSVVMLPTFIWLALPAPNDVLRGESATAIFDTVASVCQVLFVACLCIIINKERPLLRLSPLMILSITCIVLYFAGWVFYYAGIVDPIVILLLTLPPCLAFIFFALDRKNMIALAPAVCFTVCHLIYGTVNFII